MPNTHIHTHTYQVRLSYYQPQLVRFFAPQAFQQIDSACTCPYSLNALTLYLLHLPILLECTYLRLALIPSPFPSTATAPSCASPGSFPAAAGADAAQLDGSAVAAAAAAAAGSSAGANVGAPAFAGDAAAAAANAGAPAFARDASDAAAIAGAPAFAGDAATGGRNPEGAEAGTIAIPVDDACTGAVAADADGLVLLMLMVAAADDAGAGAAVATADGLSPRVPRVV